MNFTFTLCHVPLGKFKITQEARILFPLHSTAMLYTMVGLYLFLFFSHVVIFLENFYIKNKS